MSTNIHDAWHLEKSESIHGLTKLARRVRTIQEETWPAELARLVISALDLWIPNALEFFGDDAADEFSAIAAGAVYPILRRNALQPTWVFPDCERQNLRDFLTRHLKGKYVPDREESMDDLQSVCESLYEFSAQFTPSLCFLSDSAGKDVYVKAFGITRECVKYFDSLYERFEYTDACEMDESDFPALKKQFAAASDKDRLLSKAQTERGALWNDALNGCTRYKDAGLVFPLGDVGDLAKTIAGLRKAAKIIFENEKRREAQ